MMNQNPKGMKVFFTIWIGQLVSTIGSGLTGFALGVWLYQETGSVTLFAINTLAFTLPSLIVTPFAGALADRWNRRWLMVLSDAGAGFSTLTLFLLLSGNILEVWHVYLITAAASSFNAFQGPAYLAATTMLVPKEHLGRASGLTQLGDALSNLVSPAIAGALFISIGLKGIIFIDFITFGVAVLTLLLIRIPSPKRSEASEEAKGSLLKEAAYGWKYIRARTGLFGLLLYFAVANFLFGMINPLFLPMMLNLTTTDVVGYLASLMGIGMLAGILVMSVWGGPKRKVNGISIFGAWIGLFLALAGLRPSIPLIAVSIFGVMFGLPIVNGSSQALWQSKVAADVQGRVFAVRRMIASSLAPIAILLAGPLADYIFEPWLVEGGALANSVGQIIGVGPGRGTGLIFITQGALVIFSSLALYLHPRIRLVEDEVPDAIITPVDEPGEKTAVPDPKPIPS